MEGIHIALKAESLGHFFGIPFTNALLTTLVVTIGVVFLTLIWSRGLKLVPGKAQTFFELSVGGGFDYVAEVLESKELARRFFPLIASLFIFIFAANLFNFLPGIGSIIVHSEGAHGEGIALFRAVNTDLNVTLALAIVAFLTIEIAGVSIIGFLKYAKKFVNLSSILGFVVGIIELFSEVARLVSFSFRLFGNIFAGKVMLAVLIGFIPFVVPVPLMVFELLVGFMQAAIFSLLTLFFIKIAISEAH